MLQGSYPKRVICMVFACGVIVVCSSFLYFLYQKNRALEVTLQGMALQLEYLKDQNNTLKQNAVLCGASTNGDMVKPPVACEATNSLPVNSKQPSTPRFVFERVEQDILRKYAYLFQTLAIGKQDAAMLIQLLAKREQVLNAPVLSYFSEPDQAQKLIEEQQSLLLEIDAQTQKLLGDDGFTKYELLKDSGYEQFQLEQFNRELSFQEQLSNDQKSQLLWLKLESKQAFEQNVTQFFADTDGLTISSAAANDDQLFIIFENYKNNYLSESAALLTPKQFSQLKSFEVTLWADQYQSLRQQLLNTKSTQ